MRIQVPASCSQLRTVPYDPPLAGRDEFIDCGAGLGPNAEPTAGGLTRSPSRRTPSSAPTAAGFDGGKLINGRKRRVLVDTLGLLLDVMLTAADTGDRSAAQVLLEQVTDARHQLELVWADGGYTGSLAEYCLAALALVLAIVKRSDDIRGYVVLPKRWILERLFAHLMRTRRLARPHPVRA